jgi:hypothetical protein
LTLCPYTARTSFPASSPLPGVASIFKLKVQGQVKLRPMICEGPGKGEAAFTFLLGAKEISWKYDPPDAPNTAEELRNDLIAHPNRRIEHERVN